MLKEVERQKKLYFLQENIFTVSGCFIFPGFCHGRLEEGPGLWRRHWMIRTSLEMFFHYFMKNPAYYWIIKTHGEFFILFYFFCLVKINFVSDSYTNTINIIIPPLDFEMRIATYHKRKTNILNAITFPMLQAFFRRISGFHEWRKRKGTTEHTFPFVYKK